MTRLVINKQHGGFSLSDKAVHHYAKLKGLTLYPETRRHGFITYWTVPEDQWVNQDDFWSMTVEDRQSSNRLHTERSLSNRDIPRDDPHLVQTVNDLGDDANGDCATLRIVEIPDDVEWQIEEYDGLEWVAEKHRTW